MSMTQVTPAPHRTDFLLTARLRELFNLARDQKKKYQTTWRRNWLLVTNRQYALDVQQPWSPNLTDSEIFPILSSRIAWMTDQKITPEVSPACEQGSSQFTWMQLLGEHLQSILTAIQNINGWDGQVVMALWDAAQFGAGIFKSVWDSGLTTGLGNAALLRIDPWKFYPDPNATSMMDCNYMFEVNKMTWTEIKRRFPDSADRLLESIMLYGTSSDMASRPGPSGGSTYPMAMPGNLPTSNATVWGLPGQTNTQTSILTEGVNIYEGWFRENELITREPSDPLHPTPETVATDRWRVIVFSNDIVLLDEYADHLWEHNRHPYTRYVDEDMGEFWTVPLTSHLAPAQVAINRLLSAMQGNAELIGNPIFLDYANSGITRTQIVNRPGVRLTLDSSQQQSQGPQPNWLHPPTMSTLVPNLVQFWIARMENISGITGVQRGQTPSGRQAQQTIQATQEAASVRIRSSLRNLERTLSDAYTLLAHLVIQNYTVPRVQAMVGTDGQDTCIRLAARHFYSPNFNNTGEPVSEPMKFSLIVQAGSSNPTSRQARIAESDALFAMHAIDIQAVLQAHAYPNWQKIVQRMQQQQQQLALLQAQSHQQPHGPGTGHEH